MFKYTTFDLAAEDPVAQLAARLHAAWTAHIDEAGAPLWELVHGDPSPQDHATFAAFMAAKEYPVKAAAPAADVKSRNWLAEAHVAISKKGGGVRSELAAHQDDGGGVARKVNTMVVYFENSAQGGGLEICDCDENTHEIVDTHPPPGLARVVLMRGEVWHYPRSVEGEGLRRSFVYQCERPDP